MASSSNAPPSSSSGTNSKLAASWLATQAVFVAIASLLVLARIYVRSIVIKKIGIDDILIVIALVKDPTRPMDSAILTTFSPLHWSSV